MHRKREFITSLVKPLIFLLIALLVLLFVIRPLLKWLFKSVKVVETVPEKNKAIERETIGQIEVEEIPQIELDAKSDEMKQAVKGKRRLIEKIAKDDKSTATAVVRSWLQESL